MYSELREFVEFVPVEISTIGNFGNTPLHIAARVVEEVRALLDSGGDVNAVGELGNTPLHYAVGHNMPDVAKLLITAGADSWARNDFLARFQDGLHCASYLVEHSKDDVPIFPQAPAQRLAYAAITYFSCAELDQARSHWRRPSVRPRGRRSAR